MERRQIQLRRARDDQKVSAGTLYRWRAQSRIAPERLARKKIGRASKIERDAEIGALLATMVRDNRRIRIRHLADAVAARLPDRPQPSYAALKRWARKYRAANRASLEALNHPDGYRQKFRLSLAHPGASITRLNQEWQWDGTRGDALQRMPLTADCESGGKVIRCTITVVIDVYSRRMMAQVSATPSSANSRALLYRAIPKFGVPESIHGDNGSDFVAAETQRAIRDLGIDYIFCAPYHPEQKPFVERAIGTMMHDLFERLPGYIGHDVAERKQIESRKSFAARMGMPAAALFGVSLTPEQLQQYVDDWCEHVYGNRPHAGLGGSTPNQMAREYQGEIRRIPDGDERALMLLFSDSGLRAVTNEGIRIENARYWDHALIPHVGGPKVRVFTSPDMGRLAVFAESPREFICIAKDPDREGWDRAALAIEAKRMQSLDLKRLRAEHRANRARFKPHRIIDAVIANARGIAAAPSLASEISITTSALQAAAAAFTGPAPLPDAHPDRAEIDAAYDEIITSRQGSYDEEAEASATVNRWNRLMATPRDKWTDEDMDFFDFVAPLPEIRALKRRVA